MAVSNRSTGDGQMLLPFEGSIDMDLIPVGRKGGRRVFLEGKKYGRWLVRKCLGYSRKRRQCVYLCECECGTLAERAQSEIISKREDGRPHSESCGCLCDEKKRDYRNPAYKHGGCRRSGWSPEYSVWASARQRCRNSLAYVRDGITFHPAWDKSFVLFLEEVGKKPGPGYTLERINNKLGYVPGNVRWATVAEQARNKRSNRFITLHGVTKCITDWSREKGVSASTILRRMRLGLTPAEAMVPKRRVASRV